MLNATIILFSTFCCFYFDNDNLFNLKIESVPLFHAIIVGLGTNLLFLYNSNILYDPYKIFEYNNDGLIYHIFPLFSLSYSFYDLYLGIKKKQIEYIFHGTILMLVTTTFYYMDALVILNIPLLGEMSTIFLNLRPIRNDIIECLFIITFTLYRMIYIPIVTVLYIYNSPCINIIGSTCKIEIMTSIFLFLFYGLTIYWFYSICKKVMRRINRGSL